MIYFGLKPIAKFLRMKDALAFSSSSMSQVIKSLFANNEQGFAFDFNDLSTMYQDSAGTIPVTGVEQPVGKVLDKSGRGNHATQSTSAKRPILQKNATTGAYYLSFDGVDDFLTTASFPAMGLGTTLFAGTECNKAGTTVIAGRSASGYFYQTNAVIGVQGSNPTNVSVSGKTVATAIYSDNGNDVTIRANKLTNTQPNTARGFNNTVALTIGSLNTTGTLFYQGNIYSVVGINRVATPTEITNTENAIAKNVGVTL